MYDCDDFKKNPKNPHSNVWKIDYRQLNQITGNRSSPSGAHGHAYLSYEKFSTLWSETIRNSGLIPPEKSDGAYSNSADKRTAPRTIGYQFFCEHIIRICATTLLQRSEFSCLFYIFFSSKFWTKKLFQALFQLLRCGLYIYFHQSRNWHSFEHCMCVSSSAAFITINRFYWIFN